MATTTITLYPVADAYVDVANPTTNYGATNYLEVNDGMRTWIRFDLSGIPAGKTITSATLSVRQFFGGYAMDNIQRCTNISWTEAGLTWNNAPNANVLTPVTGFMTSYGAQPYTDFDVTGEVTSALSAGGISWRIKVSKTGEYAVWGWFSAKEYTATGCSKLVVTYADSGTTTGWIDVPAATDGWIYGTYNSDYPPYSYGMVVTTTGEKLYIGMSSSSGREVDQIMAYYDTSASALTALGLPAGATITKVEWRIFNCGYSGSYATFTMFLFGSKTEALGTTITLGDWDFPGCTSFGAQGVSYTWSLGWKVFDITSMGINTTGYTNMGLKPGWCKTEAGTAMFEASESTNGNVPVIRIYYSVTITPPPVVGGVTLPLMGVG